MPNIRTTKSAAILSRLFFDNTLIEKILENGQRAGYCAWDDVLHIWRGSWQKPEKEVYLRWPSVANTIYGMILLDQWLDQDERPLPSEAEQISFIEQAEAEKASAFTIPQEAIDYILCGGSGISQGKYRIYEQFQKMRVSKKISNFCGMNTALAGVPTPFPAAAIMRIITARALPSPAIIATLTASFC